MAFSLNQYINRILYRINTTEMSPGDLLWLQRIDGKFYHYDTVVKYMYIEQRYGKNDCGKYLYSKMQEAHSQHKGDFDRTVKFEKLLSSFDAGGFDSASTLGVDKNFYLRDGAHRNALSLYLNLDKINVNFANMEYRRDYSIDWFAANGFSESEISVITEKHLEISDRANRPLQIVLWGSCADETDDVAKILESYGKIISIKKYNPDINLCAGLCKKLLTASDIHGKIKNPKITVKNPQLAVISLKLNIPEYIFEDNDELKILKRFICYRIPVFRQVNEIHSELATKTFVNDRLVFIPQNFYINRKFCDILEDSLNNPSSQQ